MENIKFLEAKRTTPFEVKAKYSLGGEQFKVTWNCVHEETGDVGDYSLGVYVESANDVLSERVSNAIKDGEDGEDGWLYLFVRDTYNSQDAQNESHTIEIKPVEVYEQGNGFLAKALVDGELAEVYLQLPITADSQHAVLSGCELSEEIIDEIAELAEDSFESYLDMFVQENITTGLYREKSVGIIGYGYVYLIDDGEEIHLVGKDEGYSSYFNKAIYNELDINGFEGEGLEQLLSEIEKFKEEK